MRRLAGWSSSRSTTSRSGCPRAATLLEACRELGRDIPTLCYGDTLTPKNACRVCMVEVEGSRVLVPSCSRRAEPGMVVRTGTERARHSRRLVLELLGSSVDLSIAPDVARWNEEYGAQPARFGAPAEPSAAGERDALVVGHHHAPHGDVAATVEQPAKVDNDLYVRDYAKCILCYKCVDACGEQWQGTFAISVAGRGLRRPHLDRARRPADRVGLRLLRQLHRRVPDGRAGVQERVRPPGGGPLGRGAPDPDGHHLPVLRCRAARSPSTSRTTRSSR